MLETCSTNNSSTPTDPLQPQSNAPQLNNALKVTNLHIKSPPKITKTAFAEKKVAFNLQNTSCQLENEFLEYLEKNEQNRQKTQEPLNEQNNDEKQQFQEQKISQNQFQSQQQYSHQLQHPQQLQQQQHNSTCTSKGCQQKTFEVPNVWKGKSGENENNKNDGGNDGGGNDGGGGNGVNVDGGSGSGDGESGGKGKSGGCLGCSCSLDSDGSLVERSKIREVSV